MTFSDAHKRERNTGYRKLISFSADLSSYQYFEVACASNKNKSFHACILNLCRIVEFATKDDMKTALKKFQGREINGKKIKLSIVSEVVLLF